MFSIIGYIFFKDDFLVPVDEDSVGKIFSHADHFVCAQMEFFSLPRILQHSIVGYQIDFDICNQQKLLCRAAIFRS
jgi:hypothetical protein